MGIGGWLLLAGIGAGIGGLMYLLYNDESGVGPCCGCGQCIAAGHCVMDRRRRTKRRKEFPEGTGESAPLEERKK